MAVEWGALADRFGAPVLLSFFAAAIGTAFGRWTKKNDVLVLLQVSMSALHEKVTTLTAEVSSIKSALREAASTGDVHAIREAAEEMAREGRAATVMLARLQEQFKALRCQNEPHQEKQ